MICGEPRPPPALPPAHAGDKDLQHPGPRRHFPVQPGHNLFTASLPRNQYSATRVDHMVATIADGRSRARVNRLFAISQELQSFAAHKKGVNDAVQSTSDGHVVWGDTNLCGLWILQIQQGRRCVLHRRAVVRIPRGMVRGTKSSLLRVDVLHIRHERPMLLRRVSIPRHIADTSSESGRTKQIAASPDHWCAARPKSPCFGASATGGPLTLTEGSRAGPP